MTAVPSTFQTHAQSLIQRIQRRLSVVELVHIPHERWPLPVSS
jgi:nicotinamide-nucleotide adenylyltransferase